MENKKVKEKLQEALEMAIAENDANTVIVLYALMGSRESGDSHLLAEMVQEIVREILMPMNEAKILARKISQN